MAGSASAHAVARAKPRWVAELSAKGWLPSWSPAAATRALRAAIVMPAAFVIAERVIGNPQMALFAAFGSFATLVLAGFGGTSREKLEGHLVLALAGSVLLTVGTAVASSTALAAIVTVPVAFAVFFAGSASPNAGSAGTAALLAYILPAATSGTIGEVPDRLAGWWLASLAGTAAVLVFADPPGADRLRAAAGRLSAALADQLEAIRQGAATEERLGATIDLKRDLLAEFNATAFRPTGVTLRDQAFANAVELLEWCTSLAADAVRERIDVRDGADVDRQLLDEAAAVLRASGELFARGRTRPDLERLDALRRRSVERLQLTAPERGGFEAEAQIAFHVHAIAATVLAIGADALLAAGLTSPDALVEASSRWFAGEAPTLRAERRFSSIRSYAVALAQNASLRSVWFINSARGALALAVAVAVADLSTVQHGFWVVLGTLSVLRTSAASTGATALRALAGTAAGFALGAALLAAIGTTSTALWVALPIAVLVAAYAPGTAPFAVGQAAFTVTIVVLFNLLVPIGWRVGELRIEDVALGCLVSVVVGTLFWPRGVASVVADDLADAYRSSALYLRQAVAWVTGSSACDPGSGAPSVTAALRLDDALRAYLTEQGTKHVSKQELWRLVGGTLRLRLTADAVAVLPRECARIAEEASDAFNRRAERLYAWYGELAAHLGRPRSHPLPTLAVPALQPGTNGITPSSPEDVWLAQHIEHLVAHTGELVAPAAHVAELRRRPWWR